MKKYACLTALTLFLFLAFSLWAEPATESERYAIIIDSSESAAAQAALEAGISGLKRELELRFDVYNRLFRFDPSLLSAPLRVRVFSSKENYDRYIAERLGDTRPGALYLHYNQSERRELVIHKGSAEEAPMLAHQAFIQYLRAFVANPPSWMREGFAIYFSTLRFIPPETLSYEENLQWLEPVKNLGNKQPSLDALLLADVLRDAAGGTGVSSADFQISSWALVSFLLNGGRDYFRTLTDSFMLLSPSAQAADNSQAVMRRFSLWTDSDVFAMDFRSYISSRRTFRELMDDGHRAYSRGDAMSAELSFMAAMDQRPSDYAPYYYLGLLFYEEKNYETAEIYYLASLERGADEALINYALGINAASAGNRQQAKDFLQKAAAMDPARYRARVEELLVRIERD
jgi:hypothetical protein